MTIKWAEISRADVISVVAMCAVITCSNILVQYPINDWLTWGHFSFPITFLIADLVNRRLGVSRARRVAYVGFLFAVILSSLLATPRIALASGAAFIIGQLTDITVFDWLRNLNWWKAPLISSSIASAVDTVLFYSIAFAGTGLPWVTWSLGDFMVKILSAVFLLLPFFVITNKMWANNKTFG